MGRKSIVWVTSPTFWIPAPIPMRGRLFAGMTALSRAVVMQTSDGPVYLALYQSDLISGLFRLSTHQLQTASPPLIIQKVREPGSLSLPAPFLYQPSHKG